MVRRMGISDFEEEKGITAREIMINDSPQWSGLLNAEGMPLYKRKEPFGFVGSNNDKSSL